MNSTPPSESSTTMPPERQVFETPEFRWIDIFRPNREELQRLDDEFHFHPLDLEDVLRDRARPKLVQHPDYLFIEVHIPLFEAEKRRIRLVFLDIFVTHTHVITIHKDPIPELEDYKKEFDAARFPVGQEHKTGHFFTALLEYLFQANVHKLDHISDELSRVEDLIFENRERDVVEELLTINRDLISFRRIFRPQKSLFSPLFRDQNGIHFFSESVLRQLEGIVIQISETWDQLDNLSEMSRALDQTTNELLSHKVNQKMKLITFLSTMLFPLSVLLTMLRLELPGNPFLRIPNMYAIAIAMAGLFFAVGLLYFRKRDLL